MVAEVTRVLSDLHYGDPASRVRSLDALRPLFSGADRVVLNGDSVETRRSPISHECEQFRREFLEFARVAVPGCVLVTGNHDADLSGTHHLELLGGLVFITHGEVLFNDLVPWSRELPEIRRLYRNELDALPAGAREVPSERLMACKRACARLELTEDPHPRHPIGRLRRTLRIFWPPSCTLGMVLAWRALPYLAVRFANEIRPGVRFVMVGHTHRPGVWMRSGVVIINTGSFRPPFGCYAIDITPEHIVVREVRHSRGSFSFGRVIAAFALAPTRGGLPAAGSIVPTLAPAP